jgi:anti-anti-sigma factor
MRQTTFSTSFSSDGRDATVLARGDLDLVSAPALQAAVRSCIDARYARIGVDMDAVTFMDCSGINAILDCRIEAAVPGSIVFLLRPSLFVRRVLTLTRTNALLAA